MLFKRRKKLSFGERVRDCLWPHGGWVRTARYIWRRSARLSGTPHSIAAGFSSGALASFTPFVGFHFIIGLACASITRGNILAAIFGTFVGNPLTFPFIWFATYSVGKRLLASEGPSAYVVELPQLSMWTMMTDPVGLWRTFAEQMIPIIKPMTVGGMVLGIPSMLVLYFFMRWGVAVFQAKRRRTLLLRRESRRAELARTRRLGRGGRSVEDKSMAAGRNA